MIWLEKWVWTSPLLSLPWELLVYLEDCRRVPPRSLFAHATPIVKIHPLWQTPCGFVGQLRIDELWQVLELFAAWQPEEAHGEIWRLLSTCCVIKVEWLDDSSCNLIFETEEAVQKVRDDHFLSFDAFLDRNLLRGDSWTGSWRSQSKWTMDKNRATLCRLEGYVDLCGLDEDRFARQKGKPWSLDPCVFLKWSAYIVLWPGAEEGQGIGFEVSLQFGFGTPLTWDCQARRGGPRNFCRTPRDENFHSDCNDILTVIICNCCMLMLWI